VEYFPEGGRRHGLQAFANIICTTRCTQHSESRLTRCRQAASGAHRVPRLPNRTAPLVGCGGLSDRWKGEHSVRE
jgi:hypothetical protein